MACITWLTQYATLHAMTVNCTALFQDTGNIKLNSSRPLCQCKIYVETVHFLATELLLSFNYYQGEAKFRNEKQFLSCNIGCNDIRNPFFYSNDAGVNM